MGKIKIYTAKILYGMLFVIMVPLLLLLWARFTGQIIDLPVPGNMSFGYILLLAGLSLVISGIGSIWYNGKGLPMNAFPPRNFVKNGIYGFMRHPIYSGAVLISFGFSIITGSASGFWLVSPLFMLLIAAYVTGFENERTLIVFGPQDYKPFLSLPANSKEKPTLTEKASAYIIAFLPGLLLFSAFIYLGEPKDVVTLNLPFKDKLQIWQSSAVLYLVTFLFVFSVPMVARSKAQLKNFVIDILFGTIITSLFYFVFPIVVTQKDLVPGIFLERLRITNLLSGSISNILITISVFCTFISAKHFSVVINHKKWLWYLFAVMISLFGIISGSYYLIALITGLSLFMVVVYRLSIWNFVRWLSERLANSWHEWRFGPLRVINHGFYGGAAGFAGMLITGFFLGKDAVAGLIIILFMIIGSGLWAQLIEGSSKLLRPYGYYGGLLGLLFAGALVFFFFSIDFFIILGSFAMAGPWIQCLGRLRCLVQGCCHGKPSDEKTGIRFSHPASRVNKISGFRGVYLYPTQLYSIGTNIITGLILIRLYTLDMPSAFICGIYLILNGAGRFVEESYRGEAQTPYWAGMRIYQWIAIINILAGIVFTTFRGTGTLIFQPDISSFYLAVIAGVIVTIASGVDFPESNRRYARLTS